MKDGVALDMQSDIASLSTPLAVFAVLVARYYSQEIVSAVLHHHIHDIPLTLNLAKNMPFEQLVETVEGRLPGFVSLPLTVVFHNTPLTIEFRTLSDGTIGPRVLTLSDFERQPLLQRLLNHYEVLKTRFNLVPHAPIRSVPLITENEREQLLIQWNDTARNYPIARTLLTLLHEQMERTPGRAAIKAFDTTIDYWTLYERAAHVGRVLAAWNVQAGQVVGILSERSTEAIVATLGILHAGGAFLTLSPQVSTADLAQQIHRIKPNVLLVGREMKAQIDALTIYLPPRLVPDILWLEEIVEWESADVTLDTSTELSELACVDADGAMIPEQSLINQLYAKIEALELAPSDRVLHDDLQKSWQWLAPLLVGATVYVCAQSNRFKAIEHFQTNIAELRGSYFRAALQSTHDLSSLRCLILSCGVLSPADCRDWFEQYPDTRLLYNFGFAECAYAVTHYVMDAAPHHNRPLPVGRPIGNMRVYVLDQRRQPVPVGVIGELYVGGIGVGRGYINAPQKTARRFPFDPFSFDTRARLFRTGYHVRFHEDGNLEWVPKQT